MSIVEDDPNHVKLAKVVYYNSSNTDTKNINISPDKYIEGTNYCQDNIYFFAKTNILNIEIYPLMDQFLENNIKVV